MENKIKVMTFNLRVRSHKDGINCFDFRRERILEVIEKENPDIIGFQEATDIMLCWLKSNLSDYVVLGHGRKEDYHGEGTPIAYKKELFDLHRFEATWLSYTPDVPASRLDGTDQSSCPRMMIYTELIHRDSDKPFAFCNVHTDHRGVQARASECFAVMQRLFTSPWRFILTGDFNALPDSAPIQSVVGTFDAMGTVDTTKNIVGSFHGFTGDAKNCKIDYIFTNLPTDPDASYAITDEGVDGVYYSDHFALCAYVEI